MYPSQTDRSVDVSRPVLLLPGFVSSPRVLVALETYLRRHLGREVLRVANGPWRQDLRESAAELGAFIQQLAESPRFEYVDIVAHSMGGLVASYLLKRIDRGLRVRSVVTLGTPHQGTPLAGVGLLLTGGLNRQLRQMSPNSKLTRELHGLPVPPRSELVSLAGTADLLVPPRYADLAPLKGQRTVQLRGISHTRFLLARSVFGVTRAILEGGPARLTIPSAPRATRNPLVVPQPIVSGPDAVAA
jgi:pimeloyl-ACP methyl ester carboxylesterase